MLMEDCLKEFVFDCRLRNLSERTIKSYKNNCARMFKYVEDEVGINELDSYTSKCVQMYIDYLVQQGLREVYINSIIKSCRAFFRYMQEEGYLEKDIMKKVKFQKEEITMIETFTNEEVYRMINYYTGSRFLDIRNRLIMVMLFDTGIRNNELCDIKVDDIRETYIVIHGKGKKVRHVPITSIINKYLIKYMRIRDSYTKDKVAYQMEYLFLSQKGKKLTIETIERIVRDCGKGCNIRKECSGQAFL